MPLDRRHTLPTRVPSPVSRAASVGSLDKSQGQQTRSVSPGRPSNLKAARPGSSTLAKKAVLNWKRKANIDDANVHKLGVRPCFCQRRNSAPSASAVVTTTKGKSPSSLHQKKAETDYDVEKLTMNNDEPSTVSDTKMDTPLLSDAHRRSRRSSCCYIAGIVIICLATLGIIAAIGGVIYMEVFSNSAGTIAFKQNSESNKGEEFHKREMVKKDKSTFNDRIFTRNKYNSEDIGELRDNLMTENRAFDPSSDSKLYVNHVDGENPGIPKATGNTGGVLNNQANFILTQLSNLDLQEKNVDGEFKNIPKDVNTFGNVKSRHTIGFFDQLSRLNSPPDRNVEITPEDFPISLNDIDGILNEKAHSVLDQSSNMDRLQNRETEMKLEKMPNTAGHIRGRPYQQASHFSNSGNEGDANVKGQTSNLPKVISNIENLLNEQASRFWSQFSNVKYQPIGKVERQSLNFIKSGNSESQPNVKVQEQREALSSEKSVDHIAGTDFKRDSTGKQFLETVTPTLKPIDAEAFRMEAPTSPSNRVVKAQNVEKEISTISDAVVVRDDSTERKGMTIDSSQSIHLNSPVVEHKAKPVPFDFPRQEQEHEVTDSQLSSNLRNVELKTVVADALDYLRSVDGSGQPLSTRQASTKKLDSSTRSNIDQKSPKTLYAERQEYLQKMLQKMFETET